MSIDARPVGYLRQNWRGILLVMIVLLVMLLVGGEVTAAASAGFEQCTPNCEVLN